MRGLSLNAHAVTPDGRDGECHADHHESLIRWLLQCAVTQCGKERSHKQESKWLLALRTFDCRKREAQRQQKSKEREDNARNGA
jgi:hypothetical protein